MPDVKMDYQQMEDMTNAFKRAQSDVQNSMNAIKATAAKLADAFQGDGGSALQDAIGKILLKKMDTIAQKMGEVAQDLKTAEDDTKAGIGKSKSPYGG
jgi:WXG100 family type VII secretion target